MLCAPFILINRNVNVSLSLCLSEATVGVQYKGHCTSAIDIGLNEYHAWTSGPRRREMLLPSGLSEGYDFALRLRFGPRANALWPNRSPQAKS